MQYEEIELDREQAVRRTRSEIHSKITREEYRGRSLWRIKVRKKNIAYECLVSEYLFDIPLLRLPHWKYISLAYPLNPHLQLN